MIRKIVQIGQSVAVTIPKSLCDELSIEIGDYVWIEGIKKINPPEPSDNNAEVEK